MEAGCFRAVDTDEAAEDGPSGAVEGGVRGSSCPSRLKTQEGLAVPPPFEEPSWSGWGQEDASKLQENRKIRCYGLQCKHNGT